jgi:hypothetical protein
MKKLLETLSKELGLMSYPYDDLVKGSTMIFINDINKTGECEKINYVLGGASFFAMFICFFYLF